MAFGARSSSMADGSTLSIVGALAGNLAVAATKFGAFAVSGSSAMLTEAIHSVVDTLNQVLLLFGLRQGKRPADEAHPFGHGLEVYFWTFIVALLVFALGGTLGIYEGLQKLRHPGPASHAGLNLAVIAVSAVLEGASLWLSLRAARQTSSPILRGLLPKMSFVQIIRTSKDPGIYETLAENSAAVLGLAIAAAGVIGSAWFGLAWADGAASVAIGLLLVAVALFLVMETRSLLTGEAAGPPVIEAIRKIFDDDVRIQHVCEIRSMHLGPQSILVAATLNFDDHLSVPELEHATDELTQRLKAVEPRITSVFLRPGEAVFNDDGSHKDASAPAG